ncbi:TPA: 50S ribosomal protein L23 [Candidatus Poribacteria bacterium]|nr:50S ribosomal protein L23 [Candidatus Poribacteria bacterium]
MKDPYKIIIQPLLTERSTALREDQGKYSFWVAKNANKVEIRQAIEAIFPGVRVLSVNTMTIHGSQMRVRGNRKSKKPDWKKAIVMLRPDDRIDIYEGI